MKATYPGDLRALVIGGALAVVSGVPAGLLYGGLATTALSGTGALMALSALLLDAHDRRLARRETRHLHRDRL